MEELLEKIQQLNAKQQADLLEAVNQMLSQKSHLEYPIAEDMYEERLGEPSASLYYNSNQLSFSENDIKEIIKQFPKNKKWTFQDLQDERIFPSEVSVKIEIIHNKIYIMPNPSTKHQQILSVINAFIQMFVLKNKLGNVYLTPTSVKFDDDTVLEPDLIFVTVQHLDIVQEQAIEGVPDLVVEVISKSNYKKLREAKKEIYSQNGVQEYWEIYPKKKKISIATLTKQEDESLAYTPFSEATKAGIVKSSVLDGFELDVADIFEL